MDRAEYIRFLDSAMRSQRAAQWSHIGLAVGVIILGLLAVAVAQTLSGVLIPESTKWLVTLGGTFVSTLSTFPVKQISDRRAKIAALEFLSDGFSRLSEVEGDPPSQEAARLTERFWKLMDASLGT